MPFSLFKGVQEIFNIEKQPTIHFIALAFHFTFQTQQEHTNVLLFWWIIFIFLAKSQCFLAKQKRNSIFILL